MACAPCTSPARPARSLLCPSLLLRMTLAQPPQVVSVVRPARPSLRACSSVLRLVVRPRDVRPITCPRHPCGSQGTRAEKAQRCLHDMDRSAMASARVGGKAQEEQAACVTSRGRRTARGRASRRSLSLGRGGSPGEGRVICRRFGCCGGPRALSGRCGVWRGPSGQAASGAELNFASPLPAPPKTDLTHLPPPPVPPPFAPTPPTHHTSIRTAANRTIRAFSAKQPETCD